MNYIECVHLATLCFVSPFIGNAHFSFVVNFAWHEFSRSGLVFIESRITRRVLPHVVAASSPARPGRPPAPPASISMIPLPLPIVTLARCRFRFRCVRIPRVPIASHDPRPVRSPERNGEAPPHERRPKNRKHAGHADRVGRMRLRPSSSGMPRRRIPRALLLAPVQF